MSKPKRTPNHSAWRFVDKREPFQGSSCYGDTYSLGSAPYLSISDTWMNEHEWAMYVQNRARITYIVWSFYTPIAYYVETPAPPETPTVPLPGQWYRVGQSFSGFTSRHRNGALRNITGHMVVLKERRGDNTVQCLDCGTTRHFTHVNEARTAYYLHR